MDYFPEVQQVIAGEGHSVYVYFSDGSVRLFDVGPLISRGGVFAQLEDPDFFRERPTVLNNAVAWDIAGNYDPMRCIDLDPIMTYEKSVVVKDPLGEAA